MEITESTDCHFCSYDWGIFAEAKSYLEQSMNVKTELQQTLIFSREKLN